MSLKELGRLSMHTERRTAKGSIEIGGEKIMVRAKWGSIVAAKCGGQRWSSG